MRAWQIRPSTDDFLCHHGRKGQKWGVRNGPPYPLDATAKSSAEKAAEETIDRPMKYARMKTVISGHGGIPKQGRPKSAVDRVRDGKTQARAFYDEHGWKTREIHTNPHGNPKQHPYGIHGEHMHEYTWDVDGNLAKNDVRELTENERKENSDIL